MDHWLSVVEYASYKKISMSTLRRRIKSNLVEFRLENGKYFIKAEAQSNLKSEIRDSSIESNKNSSLAAETIQELMAELKRAYGLVLTEKESMIQQLRSEIEILKQMNQFLEHELLKDSSSFQGSLEQSL